MPTILGRLAAWSRRRALRVLLGSLVLAALAAGLAVRGLGIDTNVGRLFPPSLSWMRRQAAYGRAFPQFRDLLVAAVSARTPEAANATASALARALAADHHDFRTVLRPDSSPYFERAGLLLLSKPELSRLLGRIIAAQPFLGQLVADPSSRGLFSALSLLAMGAARGQPVPASFRPALDQFHRTLAAAAAGHPAPLSWQRLLGGRIADLGGPFRFVLVRPVLQPGALAPGAAATAALMRAAHALPFVKSGQARVRVTGDIALNDQEFATAARGALWGLAGSLALILLWLTLALRSWRLILPVAASLLLGLVLTTGFATLAVGRLNVISVAFAILFVGLAVDFGIQIAVRLRGHLANAPDLDAALTATYAEAGPQVLLAAATIAAGFLAFTPTSFRGVSELGLIAGGGMIIAFACTMLFLPACLGLCRPRAAASEAGFAGAARLDRALARGRGGVMAGALALAVLGLAVLPRLAFDSNPLHTRDPNTPAMRALTALMRAPQTNPFTIEILAPSLAAAKTLSGRLAALPEVAQVRNLASFLPTHQRAKLAMIGDAWQILAPTLTADAADAPVQAGDIRLAIANVRRQILAALPHLAPGDPLRAIDADLARLAHAPDATLLAANAALTRFLPGELARLRAALSTGPVSAKDLPASLVRDWLLPAGAARIEVVPRAAMDQPGELAAFVTAVRAIAPAATGPAVTTWFSARTIVGAFRAAAINALLAIAMMLLLFLRRARHAALVLACLVLSSLVTVLGLVALAVPLNYANVIALPLLLGVGVSFNVYFVMNWRLGARSFLASPTARAILYSALTTASAFGALAFAAQPGMASLGRVLLLSLGATLLVTFLVLPAVLGGLAPPGREN